MLNVRWKRGAAVPGSGQVLIAATEAGVARYRDLPGAALAAMRLRRSWPTLDGAVALSLAVQPLQKRTRSISVWQSEAHLLGFLRSASHLATVRRYRGRVRVRSVTWTAAQFDRLQARAEAERRLNRGSVGPVRQRS
ncbi:MAG: hypothetical protein E6G34_08400 [Actinobacteria bacterium]|nr:MAG: hypothetical protein E6G34_08400 [Actinomycetota bacterium]